jgi:hypothetical protein
MGLGNISDYRVHQTTQSTPVQEVIVSRLAPFTQIERIARLVATGCMQITMIKSSAYLKAREG